MAQPRLVQAPVQAQTQAAKGRSRSGPQTAGDPLLRSLRQGSDPLSARHLQVAVGEHDERIDQLTFATPLVDLPLDTTGRDVSASLNAGDVLDPCATCDVVTPSGEDGQRVGVGQISGIGQYVFEHAPHGPGQHVDHGRGGNAHPVPVREVHRPCQPTALPPTVELRFEGGTGLGETGIDTGVGRTRTGLGRTHVSGTRRRLELARTSVSRPGSGFVTKGTGLRGTRPLTTSLGTRVGGDTELLPNGTKRRGVPGSHQLFVARTTSEHVDGQREPLEHLESPRIVLGQTGVEDPEDVRLHFGGELGDPWWPRVIRCAVLHHRGDRVEVPVQHDGVAVFVMPSVGSAPQPSVAHEAVTMVIVAGTHRIGVPAPSEDRARIEVLIE